MPRIACTRASRSRIAGGGRTVAADVDRARLRPSLRTARPAACVATACAHRHCSGARPFSKRDEASLRSPSAQEVRWMFGPCQLATSSSTRVVSAWTSERSPPISPGDRGRAVGVLDHDHLRRRACASAPSSVVHLLALARPAHRQARAGDAVEVEGVQRLAGQQHRVVGDVDDVVDRPLPGCAQPRRQPRRRGRDRDVLEHARGEARAQLGTLDRRPPRPPTAPGEPGSSRHGAGASGAPVAACSSRATP